MKPDLALLVPSRARPHNAQRLIDQVAQRSRVKTQLVFGVDCDDPEIEAYIDLQGDHKMVIADGYRGRLVEYLNLLATDHTGGARFVGHFGDDNTIETDGWDERICESLDGQGKIGFCFGNDLDPGRAPGSLSIHIFMTATVIKKLGYMGPPIMRHMYVDPTWYAWGKRTSIEYLDDVHLPHQHYSLGRAPRDESYEYSTALIPEDCKNYNDYCDDPEGMNADIRKLGGEPFTQEEMAAFNASLNIPYRWTPGRNGIG